VLFRSIGITGGIGSGKSTIAQVFRHLGAAVYISDARAKALYTEDPELKRAVQKRFGEDVYRGNVLQRQRLAQRVFNDAQALADLNALVHPRVALDFQKWKAEQTTPYLVKEAAILIETGGHRDCDAVIVVTAPEDVRTARVMKRDGVTASDVQARMSRQWTDAQRLPYATHTLANDNSTLLVPLIESLDREFRS
jgi:dephospho-CoA kinase